MSYFPLSLSSEHAALPLSVLRMAARQKLSRYLNPPATVETASGRIPDWTGLAELINFSYIDIRNFKLTPNPTETVLDEWGRRPTATLGRLVQYLEELEREDCLTDCRSAIERDIDDHYRKEREMSVDEPIQDNAVSQSYRVDNEMKVDEFQFMTTDDVAQGSPATYDAFVCYSDKNIAFVKEMINNLEKEPHNLKLCIADRNNLPGGATNTISAQLIEDRCKKFVIVLSPAFLKSPECDFQTRFAQSLSPGARSKKLIPLLTEDCRIPKILQFITMCDFTKTDLREWFWDRLAKAIQAPLDPGACRGDANVMKKLVLKFSANQDLWTSSTSEASSETEECSARQCSSSPEAQNMGSAGASSVKHRHNMSGSSQSTSIHSTQC